MKKCLFLILFFLCTFTTFCQTFQKLRVLVLTDIEADPDDSQSLVRFLTYANQWDIEGFIATTSIHQKDMVAPESIHATLDAYGKIQANLLKHEQGYPTATVLKAKVKKHLALYGMEGVGEGKDSEGSDLIIKTLEQKDSRPVWIPVWGGTNCLAQALWKIRKTKNSKEAQILYDKIRVYTISDQDDSGPWIRKNFPSIFYIVTPGYNYSKATWLGIAFGLPGSNTEVVSSDWLAKNIQQGHGALGTTYPDVAYGMEGDTPSFLSLINNGLNTPEKPNFGGWGGRYELYLPEFEDSNTGMFKRANWPKDEPETRPIWTNAKDSIVSIIDKKTYVGNKETIWRWREAFQNDFAARMLWCTKDYKGANHPPIPKLKHAEEITVKAGQLFYLDASPTTDPDGDSVSFLWFQYPEAGTYKGLVSHKPYAANLKRLPVTAPLVNSAESVHFILAVKDKGTPALTRYKRVIINIVP